MNRKNEVVKYNNDLNTISMRGRSAEEMNFFFAIIAKIRDKGKNEIVLNTAEIKELIDYSDRENRWIKILENIANKIMGLKYIEKNDVEIAYFNMFQRFKISIPKKTVNLKVTSDFEYIVNKLTKNFTRFELEEFTTLRSTYSKTMYRILKQWRTLGVKEIELKLFRELLNIPKSYKPNDIKKRVIGPIEKELPKYFTDLKVKIIKANTKGNPVIAYRFTWVPEKVNSWDPNKYNKLPSKKQGKKKLYRSKNGKAEAKEFAEKARARRFARMMAEKEQGQTGEEILEEMQDLNKEQENEL